MENFYPRVSGVRFFITRGMIRFGATDHNHKSRCICTPFTSFGWLLLSTNASFIRLRISIIHTFDLMLVFSRERASRILEHNENADSVKIDESTGTQRNLRSMVSIAFSLFSVRNPHAWPEVKLPYNVG